MEIDLNDIQGNEKHSIKLLWWEADIINDALDSYYASEEYKEKHGSHLSPGAFIQQFRQFFRSLEKPEPIKEK